MPTAGWLRPVSQHGTAGPPRGANNRRWITPEAIAAVSGGDCLENPEAAAIASESLPRWSCDRPGQSRWGSRPQRQDVRHLSLPRVEPDVRAGAVPGVDVAGQLVAGGVRALPGQADGAEVEAEDRL